MFLLLAAVCRLGAAEPAAVVVVANESDPDSVQLGRYYAGKRGIPEDNLILLPMPLEETITWPQFVSMIWRPLQERLIGDGWIEAQVSTEPDELGRLRTVSSGHRIGYLVLCRGVPLRISEYGLPAEEQLAARMRQELRVNRASVDGELSLLARPLLPVTGLVSNPLFNRDSPTAAELGQVVKVTRLDGPTLAAARGLVDGALAGEQGGLHGNAYIDLGGGPASGDVWLRAAGAQLQRLGFNVITDSSSTTFPATADIRSAAVYLGWYSNDLDGPFAAPGFRFEPGAIALHIHSFSAETLRSETRRWAGPLVARGAAATVGNVWEPYLEFSHRPDLLIQALARGWSWGDAAYFALPALGWQAVAVGDPLYRPFRGAASGR